MQAFMNTHPNPLKILLLCVVQAHLYSWGMSIISCTPLITPLSFKSLFFHNRCIHIVMLICLDLVWLSGPTLDLTWSCGAHTPMDHHTEGAAMKNKCLRDNREISTWTSGLVFISRGDTFSVSLLIISIWGN